MNEGIHLDLDTWIVPGQIRTANLCRGLGNRYRFLIGNKLLLYFLLIVANLIGFGLALAYAQIQICLVSMVEWSGGSCLNNCTHYAARQPALPGDDDYNPPPLILNAGFTTVGWLQHL